MNFYLKCWIPSLSSYSEISELNIGQFTVLAKYMLNNDDTGINKTFENIIENNLLSRYRDWETDRKSTRLNSSHSRASRMPSSA